LSIATATCRRHKLAEGENVITYSATLAYGPGIRAADAPQAAPQDVLNMPTEALHYLLPSRYCPSDRLMAAATDMFGSQQTPLDKVQAIVEWLYNHVKYQYGISNVSTSAVDTLLMRQGVCRDFAHLAISLCRALTIPARYISGYCLGLEPPDMHAYFQAYVGGQWIHYDATSPEPREALIEVSRGRDAADCAWCTIYGPAQTTNLSVSVRRIDDAEGADSVK
jgi:transglutaminase-like putative cysteine protease